MKIVIVFLCAFCFCSCQNKISTPLFSFEKPTGYSFQILENDTFSGSIVINESDTFIWRFGYSIGNLSEKLKPIYYMSERNLKQLELDLDGIILAKEYDFDPDEYRERSIWFKVINGVKFKFVRPREEVDGILGCYVDEVNRIDGKKIKFLFYSELVPYDKQDDILGLMKTIRFDKNKIIMSPSRAVE